MNIRSLILIVNSTSVFAADSKQSTAASSSTHEKDFEITPETLLQGLIKEIPYKKVWSDPKKDTYRRRRRAIMRTIPENGEVYGEETFDENNKEFWDQAIGLKIHVDRQDHHASFLDLLYDEEQDQYTLDPRGETVTFAEAVLKRVSQDIIGEAGHSIKGVLQRWDNESYQMGVAEARHTEPGTIVGNAYLLGEVEDIPDCPNQLRRYHKIFCAGLRLPEIVSQIDRSSKKQRDISESIKDAIARQEHFSLLSYSYGFYAGLAMLQGIKYEQKVPYSQCYIEEGCIRTRGTVIDEADETKGDKARFLFGSLQKLTDSRT